MGGWQLVYFLRSRYRTKDGRQKRETFELFTSMIIDWLCLVVSVYLTTELSSIYLQVAAYYGIPEVGGNIM